MPGSFSHYALLSIFASWSRSFPASCGKQAHSPPLMVLGQPKGPTILKACLPQPWWWKPEEGWWRGGGEGVGCVVVLCKILSAGEIHQNPREWYFAMGGGVFLYIFFNFPFIRSALLIWILMNKTKTNSFEIRNSKLDSKSK